MHHKLIGKVQRQAKMMGLFLLYHNDGRWEFLSATTGKSILTWWEEGQNWAAGKAKGKARTPFGAMHAAKNEEKTRAASNA